MIYKANIRKIFGSRLGGKGAYIYELGASGRERGGQRTGNRKVRSNKQPDR